MARFGPDLVIIGVYFVVIISIGLRAARGQRTMESYAMGDRSLPWWAVLASILAAEISAGTFLGTPSEGFAKRRLPLRKLVIGTVNARLLVAAISSSRSITKGGLDYEASRSASGADRRLASAVFLLTARGERVAAVVAAILQVLAWEVAQRSSAPWRTKERFHQEMAIYAVAVGMSPC
jgi:hypothetical protein